MQAPRATGTSKVTPLAPKAANNAYQLKEYKQRLHDAITSFKENFLKICELLAITDASIAPPPQAVDRQLRFENSMTQISVLAVNTVRAAEKLLRLIGDIKEYLIINDLEGQTRNLSNLELSVTRRVQNVQAHLHNQRTTLANDAHHVDVQLMQNALHSTL